MPDEPTPTAEEKTVDSNLYEGPVYAASSPGGSHDDEWHKSVDALVSKFAHRKAPLPHDAYTVIEMGVHAPDARQQIADHLEATESHGDAMDTIDGDAVVAMQAFLDEWWGKCGVVNWHKGKERVVFSAEHRAAYDQQVAEWAAIDASNEADRVASAARWQAEMAGSPDHEPTHE